MDRTTEFNNNTNSQQKKVLASTVFRAVLLGAAFLATIWMIGVLNSGSLFTGETPTASLLGIPAQRGH